MVPTAMLNCIGSSFTVMVTLERACASDTSGDAVLSSQRSVRLCSFSCALFAPARIGGTEPVSPVSVRSSSVESRLKVPCRSCVVSRLKVSLLELRGFPPFSVSARLLPPTDRFAKEASLAGFRALRPPMSPRVWLWRDTFSSVSAMLLPARLPAPNFFGLRAASLAACDAFSPRKSDTLEAESSSHSRRATCRRSNSVPATTLGSGSSSSTLATLRAGASKAERPSRAMSLRPATGTSGSGSSTSLLGSKVSKQPSLVSCDSSADWSSEKRTAATTRRSRPKLIADCGTTERWMAHPTVAGPWPCERPVAIRQFSTCATGGNWPCTPPMDHSPRAETTASEQTLGCSAWRSALRT
mmetsp:Transcript_98593/g.228540  ORF Transcript_98593/g.228540 Transcript_98593/m.228540 type:complete len:356 (+) Transcript_98593:386-1453(+)